MFGKDAVAAFEQEIASLGGQEGIADALSDRYNELLALGLSKVDVSKVLDGNKKLIDMINTTIDDLLSKALKEDHKIDAGAFTWTDEGGNLTGLDSEAKSLMYSLVGAGKTTEELQAIFEKSESLDQFKISLKE